MFLCEEDGFLIWLTIFCILWDLWGLYQLILSSLYLGLFPNSWNQNINWCILSKDEWKNMTYWLPSETGMSLHMNKEKKLFEYSNCSFLFCWITIESHYTYFLYVVLSHTNWKAIVERKWFAMRLNVILIIEWVYFLLIDFLHEWLY